jgi:hypothetical protein
MSEIDQPPSTLPWAQFRDQLLTAREVRRKAVIEARLQLREDLITARFAFRRAVVHSVGQLVSKP